MEAFYLTGRLLQFWLHQRTFGEVRHFLKWSRWTAPNERHPSAGAKGPGALGSLWRAEKVTLSIGRMQQSASRIAR